MTKEQFLNFCHLSETRTVVRGKPKLFIYRSVDTRRFFTRFLRHTEKLVRFRPYFAAVYTLSEANRMTKEQFLNFCRGIDGAETDQPFNDDFKTWVCHISPLPSFLFSGGQFKAV